MSPWTKRLQRSTRSFAPFSGVLLHCAFASLIQMNGPTAALAATAADDCRNFRRLNVLMLHSSDDGPSIVLGVPVWTSQAARRLPLAASNTCARAGSGAR